MQAPGTPGVALVRPKGLLSLIARLRRRRLNRDMIAQPSPAADSDRIRGVEERLDHLEALLEGLQDAVHRDSVRHERRVAKLEQQVAPAEMSRALSRDARKRGI